MGGLHELDPARGKHTHLEEHPTVAPALDIGGSVGTLSIANRQLHDLESQLRGAEQEIEVAKRIEVAEVRAVCRDRLVGLAAKDLCPTKRVLDRLSKKPAECE